MRTQIKSSKASSLWQLTLIALVLLCGNSSADSRPSVQSSVDPYQFGQKFLDAVYPDLKGKRYVVSIESAVPYDDPAALPYWFKLTVGEGPKFMVASCCFGGYANNGVLEPPALPVPSELPPSPPPAPASPKPRPWPADVDEHGASHFKQHLTAGFSFNGKRQLIGFTAEGPEVSDPVADNRMHDLFRGHPEITDDQVVAALKQAGMKYGPDDTEEFVKNLPLKKLEPFLGKLEFLSVHVSPLGQNREEVGIWPDWTVQVLATQSDGTKLRYSMSFDHLKGDLISLFAMPGDKDSPTQKHM